MLDTYNKNICQVISLLRVLAAAGLFWAGGLASGFGVERFVSPEGNDDFTGSKDLPWKTIQHGIYESGPGDVLTVLPGTYHEKLYVTESGNEKDGPITIRGMEGAIVSGAKHPEQSHIFEIMNQSHIIISGFEIRDNLEVKDGSAVRIEGKCSHIQVLDNTIHELRGKNAMAVTVYGYEPDFAISNIEIKGNTIYNCEASPSEGIAINGNVDGFEVSNNTLRDINNIGIDFIGGEKSICKDPTKVTRNGICKGNTVLRARSNYGGGFAAGIYVDGGQDIRIEENIVSDCDLGIEIGAENKGSKASGIVVTNNQIFDNHKAGIAIGGYSATKAGSTTDCTITGNILINNTAGSEKTQGEIWVQVAKGNTFKQNTILGTGKKPLLASEKIAGANTFDENVWFDLRGPKKAIYLWRGKWCEGLAAYQKASGQGKGSRFAKIEEIPSRPTLKEEE